MTREKRELTTLRFSGERFDDHGLDVDVLPELSAYKELLVETAKQVWRRRNPSRQRLPRGFELGVSLKFFRLEHGSTAVPLVREVEVPQAPELPWQDTTDEIDEAAAIIDRTIANAQRQLAPPQELPREAVPLFENFGRTLRADESIELTSARVGTNAHYDPVVRRFILDWLEPTYEDRVDLLGEVRGTDLDGSTFAIRIKDGRKIRGPFISAQETTILEALGHHQVKRLRVVGTGEFLRRDGSLNRITAVDSIEAVETGTEATEESPSSLLAMIANVSAIVPADEWSRVPRDLAERVDHYLYRRN